MVREVCWLEGPVLCVCVCVCVCDGLNGQLRWCSVITKIMRSEGICFEVYFYFISAVLICLWQLLLQ